MRLLICSLATFLALGQPLAAGASNLNSADRQFVAQASMIAAAQIAQAQVAASSKDYEIADFARQMVGSTARGNGALASVARQAGLSTDFERGLAAAAAPQALDGESYVRGYIALEEEALALFTREAQTGEDPSLRAYAGRSLAGLRADLQLARGLLPG